jgi:hypothetical protein
MPAGRARPAAAVCYGRLRREPRDGLSTIEAAGMLLSRLERRPGRGKADREPERCWKRVREHGAAPGAAALNTGFGAGLDRVSA